MHSRVVTGGFAGANTAMEPFGRRAHGQEPRSQDQRWKTALDSFGTTFDGRLSAARQ